LTTELGCVTILAYYKEFNMQALINLLIVTMPIWLMALVMLLKGDL
jgi:hypothetical protein